MRKNPSTGKRESGFTMAEVLVTVAIAAILASIAVPGFSRWLPSYRLKSAARDMVSNFQLAKITAIRRGVNCTISFNQPIGGTAYDYVVYEDADNDLEYDAGEQIVSRILFSEHYDGISFDTTQGGGDGLSFTDNDNGLPSIAFRSNGLTRNNAGQPEAGTVFLTNTRNQTKNVGVSSAGNITIN